MANSSDKQIIYSNGISAEEGGYSISLNLDELFELVQAECDTRSEREKEYLEIQIEGRKLQTLGPRPSDDPTDLKQVHWGLILPQEPLTEAEQKHYQALKPLIDYRRQQMNGKDPHVFHYKAGWNYDDFLWAEGRQVETKSMKPNIVPYYLCIIASPERIPWEFQQFLDGEYAVGRLWFDDPEDCASYIKHLLAYEQTQTLYNCKEVLFMGTQHKSDPPTQNSSTRLIKPLYDWLLKESDSQFAASLLLGNQIGQEASKTNLLKRLTLVCDKQFQLPSLLFTASHGLEYGKLSSAQLATQGALICQEYPGVLYTPRPTDYLAGQDLVEAGINLSGMVSFCFACYSAGTPLKEDWVRPELFRFPAMIAHKPFVANLPQKLLAQGCIAFIGHVSKTWDFSFLGVEGESDQLVPFVEILKQLLRGIPVGHAIDYLNERWVYLTSQLDHRMSNRSRYSKKKIVDTWKARNDFRGYVILGDPAARLQIDRLY